LCDGERPAGRCRVRGRPGGWARRPVPCLSQGLHTEPVVHPHITPLPSILCHLLASRGCSHFHAIRRNAQGFGRRGLRTATTRATGSICTLSTIPSRLYVDRREPEPRREREAGGCLARATDANVGALDEVSHHG